MASGSQAVRAQAVCEVLNDATLFDAATITCFEHVFHFQRGYREEGGVAIHVIEVTTRNLSCPGCMTDPDNR